MSQSFDDLLQAMPEIAKAVNAFEDGESRQRALEALLDAFFGHEREVRDESPDASRGGRGTPPPGDGAGPGKGEDWEEQVYANLPDEHLVASGKRDHQAVWAVSILAQLGQEATSATIGSIIGKRLGVSPEDRDNLSARLGRLTPQYLRRDDKAEGRGYQYFPTRQSLKIFEDLKRDD